MPRSHRDAQQARYHASLIIKYRFAVACHTMSMSRLSHKRMAFDGGSLAITSGLPLRADVFRVRRHVSKVPIRELDGVWHDPCRLSKRVYVQTPSNTLKPVTSISGTIVVSRKPAFSKRDRYCGGISS